MPKKSCFRRPFDKEGDKRAQALIKSASQNLYHIHWSLPSLYSCKRSLLLTCQILGLLLNTLLADRLYLVLHRNNLTVEIQMELSQKQKTFSEFFSPFLKSVWRFEHFFKKEDSHRFYISEFTESKNLVRLIPKKSRFRGPFEKQHGKRAQALLKSAWHHPYHIHWALLI